MKTITPSRETKTAYYECIHKLIWHLIHSFNGLSYHDREDFFQEASIFLVESIIEKYDSSKGVPFQNFASICLKNFIKRKINEHNRRSRVMVVDSRIFENSEIIDDNGIPLQEYRLSLLKSLCKSDSKKLKQQEKKVLLLLFENPCRTQAEISNRMGFHFASGTGAILSRLRKRIKAGLLD